MMLLRSLPDSTQWVTRGFWEQNQIVRYKRTESNVGWLTIASQFSLNMGRKNADESRQRDERQRPTPLQVAGGVQKQGRVVKTMG